MEGFIKDEDEEEEEGDESGSETGKRKHEDSEESDDQLEDEDYDLIEENLGVKVKRKVRGTGYTLNPLTFDFFTNYCNL